MPIIVHYLNPQMRPDFIEGENWKKIDADSPRMGTINLNALGDGHRIIVNKSAVAKVEEIPQDVWDKNVSEQEAQRDEQAREREDAEKKRKADAEAATLALLESKTPWGRIKKLLGRG